MSSATPPPVKLAEPLGDDEVQLWEVAAPRELGRQPLREVLARYLGIDGRDVVLAEDMHGRPALGGAHGGLFDFNWSHSGGRAVVAVARDVRPGVDVESPRTGRTREVLGLARRFFAPDEAAWLATLGASHRQSAFLQLWTAKEALLKAHGRGLAFGLHRVRIGVAGRAVSLASFEGEDPGAWQLHALDAGFSGAAALAWRGPPRRLHWRTGPAGARSS